MPPAAEQQLYTTFLASAFRSLRFGLTEAHGKGMALQFNYLTDKGGVRGAIPTAPSRWTSRKSRARSATSTHDLLTLEAQGDYAGANNMLDTLGVIRPPMQKALGFRQKTCLRTFSPSM